jgi:hypothetical protein
LTPTYAKPARPKANDTSQHQLHICITNTQHITLLRKHAKVTTLILLTAKLWDIKRPKKTPKPLGVYQQCGSNARRHGSLTAVRQQCQAAQHLLPSFQAILASGA